MQMFTSCVHETEGKKSPSKRAANVAGFTIFEVAVATFVMAFGIATSIIAKQMGFKALNDARDTTLASQIMQSEIERIRLMSWSGIQALPASATVAIDTTFSATIAAKFAVTRTVAADGARPTDVMNITLAVTWNSYDGRSHTRSFSTMYCKNGLYDYYYTIAAP
jgi:Tfp pilus assembly protein PilV